MTRLLPPVAVHLLLADADGRTLFQRRRGTGYADGQWSLPAGHVEAGETLHDACVRECAEELGVAIDADRLAFVLLQQKCDDDGQERLDVFFFADLPSGAEVRIAEPDRSDGLLWCASTAPPQPLVAYVAAALGAIARGAALAYYGYRT